MPFLVKDNMILLTSFPQSAVLFFFEFFLIYILFLNENLSKILMRFDLRNGLTAFAAFFFCEGGAYFSLFGFS